MPLLTDAKCDCDWPMLWEAGNPTFLGRLVYVRLCCLMSAMEEYLEMDFHETFDAEPLATWNAEATGRAVPEYITQRIEKKRLQGYVMEAPLESSALRAQIEDGNISKELSEHIEHKIRSKEPVETGRRKAWE